MYLFLRKNKGKTDIYVYKTNLLLLSRKGSKKIYKEYILIVSEIGGKHQKGVNNYDK